MKLLFAFILLSSVCYGQSKKDQIESLNKQIDSLNAVLVTSRDNSTKEIGSLNDKIKEVSDEVTALKSALKNLQASHNKLMKENEKLKTDLGESSKNNLQLEADLGELSKKNLDLEAKLKAIKEEKRIEEEQRINRYPSSTIKIGNLEVMTEDLGEMEWDEAMKACADLGDGWRLPTKDELNILYKNKDEIGGFENLFGAAYWSSKFDNDSAWLQDFGDGNQDLYFKDDTYYVRPVRAASSQYEKR